jgi:CheY-like chemotaxis protein
MHVLVVEDDPRLSRLLKRLLEDDRHVVEVATDGRTGLEIARTHPASSASSSTSGCRTSMACRWLGDCAMAAPRSRSSC